MAETKEPQNQMDNNNNQNDKKVYHLRPKIFKLQESFLCRTLAAKDMRSTYHFILAFCIYLCCANFIHYTTNPNEFFREMTYWMSLFDKFELFIFQHVIFTILVLFVFRPLTIQWIKLRTKLSSSSSLIDFGFFLLIASIISSIFALTVSTIIRLDVNLAIGTALLADKIRFTMKTQAFILEVKRKQETALEKDKKLAEFPTLRQLFYYLVAPTLVYRDEYPRLEKRNYKLLAKLVLQYVLCLYFILILHLRVFQPFFSKIGTGPTNGKAFLRHLSVIFLSASACCLLTFYSFLHLYMNIASQIFLFGDRVFYEDWWTCTDYSTYYRKWNILVHDWIHAYLYSPLVYLFRGNRVLAGLTSIYMSALIHEYMIAVQLRHINPILSYLFAGIGASLFAYNGLKNIATLKKIKKESKAKNSELEKDYYRRKKEIDFHSFDFTLGNTLFLLGVLNGWFVMITIYNIGYYSRKNCMNNTGVFVSFSSMIECLKLEF